LMDQECSLWVALPLQAGRATAAAAKWRSRRH